MMDLILIIILIFVLIIIFNGVNNQNKNQENFSVLTQKNNSCNLRPFSIPKPVTHPLQDLSPYSFTYPIYDYETWNIHEERNMFRDLTYDLN